MGLYFNKCTRHWLRAAVRRETTLYFCDSMELRYNLDCNNDFRNQGLADHDSSSSTSSSSLFPVAAADAEAALFRRLSRASSRFDLWDTMGVEPGILRLVVSVLSLDICLSPDGEEGYKTGNEVGDGMRWEKGVRGIDEEG